MAGRRLRLLPGPRRITRRISRVDDYQREKPDSLPATGRRIAELRDALKTILPDELRLQMIDELADLVRRVGRLDEALRIRRDDELPVYERLGDVRSAAVTRGKSAMELYRRGERPAAVALLHESMAAPHLESAESSVVTRLLDEWTADSDE
jgi:hypothetical protein